MPALTMADVVHEIIIDSPPELTLSKSSKSSGSFRSSCLSDAISIENLSHFEEISLDDGVTDQSCDRDSLSLKRAATLPPPRPSHKTKPRVKRSSYTIDSMHSVHVARTQDGLLPILPTNPSNTTIRPSRPSHRSSQTSSTIGQSQSRETRSASPRKSIASSRGGDSPRSIGSFSFLGPSQAFGRRQSWQPGRKTVSELEAEYHNSDEEVPEDAVMHNVPISPLPFSTQHSRAGSTASCGEKEMDPGDTPKRPSVQSIKTTPSSTSSHPSLPRSATLDTFPTHPGLSANLIERTKSWANCLSDDVRQLSSALDAYALRDRSRHSLCSPCSSPPRATATRRTVLEYPPLQRNNIMIDPLPISKEKEAVLARTRPSWLPPKCKREEKRHLKQWEKMMLKSEEAERGRELRQIRNYERLADEKEQVERAWVEDVVPKWDAVIDEPRTRELWWRGVPSKSRGIVWTKAIGNDLELTPATYTAALTRATQLEAEISKMSTAESQRSKEAVWFAAIDRDARTVLPETGLFAAGSPHNETLKQVLQAYTMYRSDVGYVHGIHDVAALLVLSIPTASEAFTTLANALNRSLPLAYLIQDASIIERWQTLVFKTLDYKLPALLRHLLSDKAGFSSPQEWLEPLLSTLLTRGMRADIASRIWDVYVFEGDKLLVRALVGLLARLQDNLFGNREEILYLLGWEASTLQAKLGLDEEQIIKSIRDAGKMDKASEKHEK